MATVMKFHPNMSGATGESPHIPPATGATTRLSIIPVRLRMESTVLRSSHTEVKFKDPHDQKAWEAYKRIEPRYSDANRMLAK